jgi:hypothetical protein
MILFITIFLVLVWIFYPNQKTKTNEIPDDSVDCFRD